MGLGSKRCPISEVTAGMVLGADVLSARGKVMLSANTILTEYHIERLICWGYDSLIIADDDTDDEYLRKKRQNERLLFRVRYQQTVVSLQQAFEEIQFLREVPLKQMDDVADNVLTTLMTTPGVLIFLQALRNAESYTFQHSVNVAVIAGTIGRWLNCEREKLRNIVLAGLLHDIGKMRIAPEIINKPGKLSTREMQAMRQHPAFGYELLQRAKMANDQILLGVWEHHERMDGSGYPRSIAGESISEFARIIAIADTYDAMVSDRIYRSAQTPFSVIKTIFENMFDKLDASYCTVFLENVKDYLVGSIVKLKDGRTAEVLQLDSLTWNRTLVKTEDGDFIMVKEPWLDIMQVVNS